ncbi:stage IV sporulation protein B [Lachnospiraceae bacterium KM106-2]|nr:stage IV sporulation protein B [Lachnospiraceae bacterium KM106-2]
MKKRVVYRVSLIVLLLIVLCGIVGFGYYKIDSQIPDTIHIVKNKKVKFNFSLPVQADLCEEDVSVIKLNNKKLNQNQVHIDFDSPFTIQSTKTGHYLLQLKLFGIFQYKTINVNVINDIKLIPGGSSIGIYIESKGILVLGTSTITGDDGLNYEPALNILQSGDYIESMNHVSLKNKEQFISMLQKNNEKPISLGIRRDEERLNVTIKPIKTVDGEYKIGTWIRDNTQGIGTLTYADCNGEFGALGHGITDVDTSQLMEIKDGTIYNSDVLEIVKGQNGAPGEIVGLIKTSEGNDLGEIQTNTNQGIFGRINKQNYDLNRSKALPIGLKQDIKIGKAKILCAVEGTIKEYEIEITDVEMNNKNLSKGLVIKITDKRLLSVTNGIVQGMSGSPIIQQGKIIGAVTHVFIQDSTKGYGTFIENMINTANTND